MKRIIADFDLQCINIMSELLQNSADASLVDKIVDLLRMLKLQHYSLEEKITTLEKQVNVDQKTGLLKYNDLYLQNIIKIASRALDGSDSSDYVISYVRLDIDDFSVFNNQYGHDVGDTVLAELSKILKDTSRPTDYCIRFGGEEFDLLLPSTDEKGASVFIKKLFDEIRSISIDHNGEKLTVTTSAGLSLYKVSLNNAKRISGDEMINAYKELQRQADNALYEAKYLGKNQYCIYDEDKRDDYAKIRKKYVNS